MVADKIHTAILVAVGEELKAVLRRMKAIRKPVGSRLAWTGTLAGKPVALVRSGMGRRHAEEAAGRLLASCTPDNMLIMGFCGGISEWAGPTDLVLGEYVMDWPDFPGVSDRDQPDRVLRPDAGLVEIASRFELRGARVTYGGILSVGRLISTTIVKGHHGPRAARCRALDMESAAAAWVAEEAHVPWIVVRGVTDTLEEDLPLPFEDYMRADGELDRRRIVAAAIAQLALSPFHCRLSAFTALVRLGRQSLRAARNLAAFAERFVEAT
jgi:adenosylhomocysteine nucleosidase